MASISASRSWLLALFAASNTAACAAFGLANDGFGSGGGGNGNGGNNAGGGGSIDYDAGTGGTSTGDYAYLCGPGSCDVARETAISSCQAGGSGGSTGGGGTGGAGGSTMTGTGGAGGSTMTGTGGAGGSTMSGGAGGSTMSGGAGGAGGSTMSGGAGGATMTGTGGAGGSTMTDTGSGGMAGAGGSTGTGGAPASDVECKLTFDIDGVSRSCIPSSGAPEFAPCTTASDCGPGLGCVLLGDQATGVCHAYCCGDTELCATGTYCAPRPMAEAGDRNVVVPVCVDADDCTLLATGQCPEGTGCFVVRGDGTTACIPPGLGKQGEACPCAEGYACTKLDEVCFKVCHSDPTSQAAECDEGYSCQGNIATLPDGFGLCISTNGVH